MIYVGIDVAKDKHDCCILGSDGEILFSPFTFQNSLQGFDALYEKILSLTSDLSEIKVGLEATGHYHLNLLRSLLDNGLASFVINPLHTNLYRKGQSLRKTKTDKVDAASIAMMLLTDRSLKPYSNTSYHNEELKSLTRYRFDKVQERARLKTSVSRLVSILFPELEKLVPTLHMASVYALLSEFPGASFIASAHLTRLKHLLSDASKGHYGRDMALTIRDAATSSIGSVIPAKSLELKHTIHLIQVLSAEIDEIEAQIFAFLEKDPPKMLDISGMGPRMAAVIIAEIGDFNRFKKAYHFANYIGFGWAEDSSGKKEKVLGMSKCGNINIRRLLTESAKSIKQTNSQGRKSKRLRDRQKDKDPLVVAYADKCRQRLKNKITHLELRGKSPNVATTAAARELACFIWGMMTNHIA